MMLTALKKLQPARIPFSASALLNSKSLSYFPKSQISTSKSQREANLDVKEVINKITSEDPTYFGNVEELIAPKDHEDLDFDQLKKGLEKFILDSHKKPAEKRLEYLRSLQETYGGNFEHMQNTRYLMEVDALKDYTLSRRLNFSFQDTLDNYKFKDQYDYEVLDKSDEVKAFSRANYLELESTHMQRKFKYIVNEGEHFSKFERKYRAENYLKGKPKNFVAIFNIPKDATSTELLKLFSEVGEIESYNLRRSFLGTPAAFEIMYKNPKSAVLAKNTNGTRYRGAPLYVRTPDDANYEDPLDRTMVVYNLNPGLSFQAVLEGLSKHGNVMHFEMPILQEGKALPTRDELDHYLKHRDRKHKDQKITIKTKKFTIGGSGLKCEEFMEGNALDVDDNRPIFHEKNVVNESIDAVADQNALVDEEISRKYRKKLFGDSSERIYEVRDSKAFDLSKKNVPLTSAIARSKEDPNLQYYMQTVEDIKRGSEDTVPTNDRIALNNLLETPDTSNFGYCFVTFSNTNEAKRALLEIARSETLGQNVRVTLKKHDGHIDWDSDYFVEAFEKVRFEGEEARAKMLKLEEEVTAKEEVAEVTHGYRATGFNGEFEKYLTDYPIAKGNVEEKKSPEEWLRYFDEQDQKVRAEVQEKLDEIFTKETENQISEYNRYELNSETTEEDVKYQLGRSYSGKITARDESNFERALANRKLKRRDQLEIDPQGVLKRGIEQLAEKEVKIRHNIPMPSVDTRFLRDTRNLILETSEEVAVEEFMNEDEGLMEEIEGRKKREAEYKARKAIHAVKFISANERGKEAREKREARKKELEEQNSYFDPFKKNVKKNAQESASTRGEENFNLKKENFYNQVRKMQLGTYRPEEMDELINKAISEGAGVIPLRKHFMETDKDGNEYISRSLEHKLLEDGMPDDPDQRTEIWRQTENLKNMEHTEWFRDEEANLRRSRLLFDNMMLNGFPMESFKFEPSDDCKTIDEFIERTKGQSPMYTYEKITDEDGNEVVVKLMKYKLDWDESLDVKGVDDAKNLAAEIQQYLRENGIPEEELQLPQFDGSSEELFRLYDEAKAQTEIRDVDLKIFALLSKKFPRHILEKMMTEDPFEDFNETLAQMEAYTAIKESVDAGKALTKEDFVKYASTTFDIQGRDKKYKKSKFDSF